MRFALGAVGLAALLTACGTEGPASLSFVEVSPAQPKIGDIATLTFTAVDSRGLPAEGMPVTFKLQSDVPNVELKPAEAQTNKGDGEATVQLIAHGRVASVVVIAQAGDKTAQSPPISFAGSAVSARGITFQCGPISGKGSGGIHAINGFDPGRNMIAGVKLRCNAHVADRNGDGISGALVSFLAEAGTIGPSAQSVTDVVGNAEVLYKTSYPLPKEVDPGKFTWTPPSRDGLHTGEYLAPLWMLPFEWRQNPMATTVPTLDEPRRPDPVRPGHINNPRDNLVSLIAVTSGEESFTDTNDNGEYDQGEPFDDLPEPFVDSNDNGTYDPDELYVDRNGDGVWNGGNGVWDGSTLIFAQERILWTGVPHAWDYAPPPQGAPPGYIPTIMRLAPSGAVDVKHFDQVAVSYRISDPWFNTWVQDADDDGCVGETPSVTTVFPAVFGAGGIRIVYPTVEDIFFVMRDAHDPNQVPPPPAFSPPVNWVSNISCKSTGSPEEGHKLSIGIDSLVGTVE